MLEWGRCRLRVALMGLIVILVAGCRAAPASPHVEAHDAWGRMSPKMSAVAIYVVIENQGREADRLIGATSPVAKEVEVHESVMEGDVMKMRPVAGLDIPAGGKVELKPGGYHIMLIQPIQALQAGSRVSVTLRFEKSGQLTLEADIRE